ncbi:MFS transporter [Phyllobacterium endophyticum]|uniref:MFS transporter n=1 Tax=Phyllobacterium endophyticum TaxID=1149773 RepID=A0A2P7ASG0_9HYPH|nr:MFS transporter [Phyllobacterium endophyticum]MBB3236911.1 putative MFS family arabinose efflux permease [Phyllobacterium endophyticum]PSH57154.1 MFS transporter [Phyllobacterium endophyticum]TYR40433.1 MFS transporter [Phyllobacterium endophyticum]
MTETAASSIDQQTVLPNIAKASGDEHVRGWRIPVLLTTLFLVSATSQIDRMLPFVLAESIKQDLDLSDTEMGLLTGIAFAVCYTLLSMPLARAADRGSPRFVLILCILLWSAMTLLGGLAMSFLCLAFTRFGVAFGEAGGTPTSHAIIARKIPPERRGLALGIFSMGIPLGTMVGFAVGGAIGDTLGWRTALVGAGVMGVLIGLLALVVVGPTPPLKRTLANSEPFLKASLRLLSSPAFRWLFIGSIALGFAAAPFYAFAVPFLIRTHGFSTSEAGLAFGLLQGAMGICGTLVGGRLFDHAVRSGTGRVLGPPAILFMIASLTTTAALFAPVGWLSILLFVPGMLSFAFLLPWCFGAAHLVAGKGKEAMATSLAMIGSGLLGPALGPLMVGMISDAATAAQVSNGLGLGLLIVPVASVLTGIAMLIANQRIAAALRRQ